MTENTNLELWEAVSTTDPKYTRHVDQKGGFTAINAQYQLWLATQQWGPYGELWGVRDIKWGMICDAAGNPLEATLEAGFFCPPAAFSLSTDIRYKPGNDTRKNVLTDLTTKALSKLGFNADVFLGAFDDNKYVTEGRETPGESREAHGSQKTAQGSSGTPRAQGASGCGWMDETLKFGKHKGESWRWLSEGGFQGERYGYLQWLSSRDPETDGKGDKIRSSKIVESNRNQIAHAVACMELIEKRHQAEEENGHDQYLEAEATLDDIDHTPF